MSNCLYHDIFIKKPVSTEAFEKYYRFRWEMLRRPWKQALGTEKDEYESVAYHQMALTKEGKVIGVGRLHLVGNNDTSPKKEIAQIRYMAVSPEWQNKKIGASLLKTLEATALTLGVASIFLHSRESAVGFYLKQGYDVSALSHVLYGDIQHYEMTKLISPE